MKRLKLLAALTLFAVAAAHAQNDVPFTRTQTRNVMRRVADWQINHPSQHDPLDWTNAALYVGMADWAELSERTDEYDVYWQWLRNTARRNHYQMGHRMYHADDIAVGQLNLDLYAKYGNERMLWPVQSRLEWIVNHPSAETLDLDYGREATLDRWSWCDALFMAPPVFARMYALTGDKRYAEFMEKEFRATYDYLYDKDERLFYRDWRYFDQKEANGRKVFWGRGNGWVMAGLAELLQILPENYRNRKFYQTLFTDMSRRMIELQCEDGCWHASLLDPDSYPSPETSATGFITYALAYGINAGLLDRATYLPAVIKGWRAMLKAVEADGKLGYVQPIGADPRKVTRDMTEVYGVGAFLLAGVQIYRMAEE